MKTAIFNIGRIISGNWRYPITPGSSILLEGSGSLKSVSSPALKLRAVTLLLMLVVQWQLPGLIDSHVHITFGDFTPRQNTVGYLHSYLHGGVTTSISASEVHVPGRPTDLDGVKALAVAARKCFENFKPSGMRVHAGSLILEPGLTSKDYEDVVSKGCLACKSWLWRC